MFCLSSYRCAAEFFDQVNQANKIVRAIVPKCLAAPTGVAKPSLDQSRDIASCEGVFARWKQASTALLAELRPALGHQKNADALAELVRPMPVFIDMWLAESAKRDIDQ